jgi:hypothetical protein
MEISLHIRMRSFQRGHRHHKQDHTGPKHVGVHVLDHTTLGRARQDEFSFARAGMV